MQMTPEQHAREKIDSLLIAAGWVLQNNSDFDRNAAEGVAVREFSLPNGPCDYLLFVGGKAAGVIEAKKLGSTLSGVAEQSAKYVAKLGRESRGDLFLSDRKHSLLSRKHSL
jgi:type I restriction enzyme R subunit